MSSLVHGIAVVAGFLIYMATKSIVIAAVVAVVLEGIVLAVMAALPRIKSNKEQQTAVLQGKAEVASLMKKGTGWRIAVIVIFGLLTLLNLAATITAALGMNEMNPMQNVPGVVICGGILVITILSLKKAKKWNQTIQQAQSSGQPKGK